MGLTCALVLAVISLVTASPSGYGIKSGAVAKANAAAGAYGGVGEIPIPTGGSYSGSFAKSSSSSFAASSASSSSSSFSFNGSGHVPNTIQGNTETTNTGGCSSGTCQNGIKGAPGYGSGSVGSGANAAANAGAATFVGSNSKPCTSGECSNQACTGPTCSEDKKCTSGQCSLGLPPTASSSEYDDIPVNIVNSNSYNPSDKAHSSTTSSTSVGSGCSNGNCASPSIPKSTYAAAPTFSSPAAPVYKPSTYLTLPKEEVPCTSSKCATSTGSSYDSAQLPSSYNVPVLSNSYSPSSSGKAPCSTGNCGPSSYPPNANPPGTYCASGNCENFPSPGFSSDTNNPSNSQATLPPFAPLGPSTAAANCGTSKCVASHSKYPSFSQPGPNYNVAPTSTATANTFSGSYGGSKSISPVSPKTEKPVPYAGGFGGPPGILKPNDFSPPKSPSSIYNPTAPTSFVSGSSLPHVQSVAPTSSQYKPTVNPTLAPSEPLTQPPIQNTPYKPPCTSGNCGNSPTQSSSYPLYPPYAPTESANAPPVPSCSSGNCGSQPQQPSSGTPTNSYTKPTPPSHYGDIPVGSYQKPTSSYPTTCLSGNCGHTQPSHDSTYQPTSPTGSYKPSQSAQSSYGQAGTFSSAATGTFNQGQKPSYSFGGPPGLLKPNDYNGPAAPLPSYKPTTATNIIDTTSSATALFNNQYKPSNPTYNPSTCTSGNCGSQSGPSAPSYSGQYNPPLPGSYNPSSCISGNCGSQSGSSATSYNVPYKPSAGSYNSAPCTSGNCGTQFGSSSPSSDGQYKPSSPGSYNPTSSLNSQYTPISSGSYNPSSPCSSGSCGSQPGLPSTPFGQSSGVHASAGASAKAIAYSGGFGGPPGLLKPYDEGKFVGNGLTLNGIQAAGSQSGAFGSPSAPGISSLYGKSLKDGSGFGANAGAKAGAIAGAKAFSGSFGGSDNGVGCKDGCGSSGSDGTNFGASGAAAKSVASAVSNAGAGAGGYNFGSGSFASSSASAHASAGAATKGGYGKR